MLSPRSSSAHRSPTCCCCSRWRTWATARAAQGRSLIGNAWVYTLSMGVYCTAWTYFGSVGRAASAGLWFLPIYLGPTLAMLLALDGAAQDDPHRAQPTASPRSPTSSASRYGKSRLLAGAGDADRGGRHRALRRAAAEGDGHRLRAADERPRRRRAPALAGGAPGGATARCTSRSRWPASRSPSAPATSTPPSATRAWSRRSRSSRWSSCWPSSRSASSSPGACSTARPTSSRAPRRGPT